MKLNKNKYKIGLSEVAYVGHTFGPEGLKPSSEKVRTIMEIPEPRNKIVAKIHGYCKLAGKVYLNFIRYKSASETAFRKKKC